MANRVDQDISKKIKGLGIYQIAGGVIGLGLVIGLISEHAKFSEILLPILIAIGLYSYSIFCGALLLKNKVSGLNKSAINQYLQLINFSLLGYAFKFISEVYLSAGIDLTNSIELKLNLGVSEWQIDINSGSEMMIININFVALFLIIFIDKLKKSISVEKFEIELL